MLKPNIYTAVESISNRAERDSSIDSCVDDVLISMLCIKKSATDSISKGMPVDTIHQPFYYSEMLQPPMTLG